MSSYITSSVGPCLRSIWSLRSLELRRKKWPWGRGHYILRLMTWRTDIGPSLLFLKKAPPHSICKPIKCEYREIFMTWRQIHSISIVEIGNRGCLRICFMTKSICLIFWREVLAWAVLENLDSTFPGKIKILWARKEFILNHLWCYLLKFGNCFLHKFGWFEPMGAITVPSRTAKDHCW